MLSEQLPVTTVVTPCSMDGYAYGSNSSWASTCVCGSTKPGATTRPGGVDHACVAGVGEGGADADDAAVGDADVADGTPGRPVPSTMVPLRMIRSMCVTPWGRGAVVDGAVVGRAGPSTVEPISWSTRR